MTDADQEAGAELYGWTWATMERANDLTRTMIIEAAKAFARQRAAAVLAEREACARVAESERVDAEATGDEGDTAYNRACDDISAAIRARADEGMRVG